MPWFQPKWLPETPSEHLEEALYLKWCGLDKAAWRMMMKAAAMVDDLEDYRVKSESPQGEPTEKEV